MMDAETKLAKMEKNKLLKELKKDLKKKEQKGFLKQKQKPGLRLKKQPRGTYVIKTYEQEPYKPIFFKREYEQERKNFFFK